MKNECAKAILKLIPSHMVWCDRDTLQNLLIRDKYDSFEVGRAIRYLVQKRLLVQLVVNLPPRSAIKEIYDSELDSPDPALINSHEYSFDHVMSVPIEMIGPTKRWGGICGCNRRIPKCRAEWIAHLRLSVAFSNCKFSRDMSNETTAPTTLQEDVDVVIDGKHFSTISADLLKKHSHILGSSSSNKGGGYENR